MGRAARRKQQRRNTPPPLLIAGDGIIARSLDQTFPADMAARNDLPPKVLGRHRFIATAAYIITVDQARTAWDPEAKHYLDHENLFSLGIGCWDCEQILGPDGISADSPCPAPANE